MGVRLNREPVLRDPVLLCGWAGIGNVGLVAINTMRRLVRAQEFAEIPPHDFFEPSRVIIREGLIEEMRFATTKFYNYRRKGQDLILLVGEQQPADPQKAYEMAGMVLDMAGKFGCRRVYTAGASVTMIRHTAEALYTINGIPALLPHTATRRVLGVYNDLALQKKFRPFVSSGLT